MKLVKGRESGLPADSVGRRKEPSPVLANKCEQAQPQGLSQQPRNTYYRRSIRHLCVSIYRVLFKWEDCSAWARWHLSPCVCQCWQSLITCGGQLLATCGWLAERSQHTWGQYLLTSCRRRKGGRNASARAILWAVIVYNVCKIGQKSKGLQRRGHGFRQSTGD